MTVEHLPGEFEPTPDKTGEKAVRIVAQVNEADARVLAGIDPIPPYFEGTPEGNIAKIKAKRQTLLEEGEK